MEGRTMKKVWLAFVLCLLVGVGFGAVRSRSGQGGVPPSGPPVQIEPDAVAVRILFGRKDMAPTAWDGSLAVTNGSLVRLEGWRFRQNDQITGPSSWKASSRRQQPGPGQRRRQGANAPMAPNGLVATLKANPLTEVRVTTPKGEFRFSPLQLALGSLVPMLEGNASVERVFPDFQVTSAATEDDFPAAAAGKDGTLWAAYVAYRYGEPAAPHLRPMQAEPQSFDSLRQKGNGDQVRLARLARDGAGTAWSDVAGVTGAGQDVYRPAVAVDGEGNVWVAWSQNVQGNWDLYARRYRDGSLSGTLRVTTDPGPDLHAALATDAQGDVWLAWQGFRREDADIFLTSVRRGGDRWASPLKVSASPRNDWDPQLACGADGTVSVAWDTYDKGDYDVMLRQVRGGKLSPAIPVAASRAFEARPSLVCDAQSRVWVAWEEAPEGWGKDFGYGVQGPGIPLYRNHTVDVRCYASGQLHRTAGDLAAVLPARPGRQEARQGETLGQAARRAAVFQASFPRLGTDRSGRVFLAFRRPIAEVRTGAGTAWFSLITAYEGGAWSPATLVPKSDGLLDSRPAFVAGGPGGLTYLIHSSDGRNHAAARDRQFEVFVSPVVWGPVSATVEAPRLAPAEPAPAPEPDPRFAAERADVERIRGFRSKVGGKTYRLLRGEFHRHTEISGDGGGDGPLIDMWRYGLDAAHMDWIGNGDHDHGGGREYTWWLTQKLTDAFRLEGWFNPMFTYERSVRYPDGHRNVMFAQRGIRTLPRLAGDQPNGVSPGDTKMLYRYLRHFDGICASHTSATATMGTDWRDNDPKVEPFVEIYQGDRNNYEYAGAPRSGDPASAPGGYQTAGFVWNALAKGYRLGFQSSSDHISTHISYAVAYAEAPTREAILDAFKKRHSYGATDNIILEVRSGDQLMGDEFETRKAPRLQIRALGTKPIARVIVVKDNKIVHTATPGKASVQLTWMDADARARTSYYYVRVEQEDGQLAWASPMWIRYRP
jgi:hypothetical protein